MKVVRFSSILLLFLLSPSFSLNMSDSLESHYSITEFHRAVKGSLKTTLPDNPSPNGLYHWTRVQYFFSMGSFRSIFHVEENGDKGRKLIVLLLFFSHFSLLWAAQPLKNWRELKVERGVGESVIVWLRFELKLIVSIQRRGWFNAAV